MMNIKKILLIEDDSQIRTNLTDLLEISGYEVFTASNGKEGLKLVEVVMPDMILCDIMMPEMDGYQFKEELSKKTKTESLPFIFLTAKGEIDDLRKGMELGADDYLIKPINIDHLIKVIKVREKRLQSLLLSEQKTSAAIVPGPDNYKKKIMIDTGREQVLVNLKDIFLISANGDYSYVHYHNSKKIVRKRLKEWEENLPAENFIRVHRSTIINIDYIEKVEKLDSRTYLLKIKNYKDPIIASQRKAVQLKNALSL